MNAIAKVEPRRSVVATLANSYGMEPDAFEATLRGTVFPASGTREEFAAFVLVAKEYKLNPLLREIYAFPKKGGGIVPIVGIDGWLNLINGHPQFDGMEFDQHDDEKGNLLAVTCRIYRKDRSHPTVVTEYLDECIRGTEPWKMKRRMLRHKSAMQGARYAFGFSGIYDEEEAHEIAQTRDVPPAPPPVVPTIDAPPPSATEIEDATILSETAAGTPPPSQPAAPGAEASTSNPPAGEASASEAFEHNDINPDDEIGNLIDKLAHAKDEATVEEWYVETDIEAALEGFEGYVKKAQDVRDLHLQRVRKLAEAAQQADTVAPPPPPPAGGLDDDAAAPPAAGPDLSTVEGYQRHLQEQLDAAQVADDFAKIRGWWTDTRDVRNKLDMSGEKRVELQELFGARKTALGIA